MKPLYTLLLALLCVPICLLAQEEVNNEVVVEGTRYVSLKIKRLEKYNNRVERQQRHVLKKLKKKEHRFAKRLKRNDSAGYARYSKNPVTYDSIDKLSKADKVDVPKYAQKGNAGLQKAKGASQFVESKTGLPSPGSDKLIPLEGRLTKNDYVGQLIGKRSTELEKLNTKGGKGALKGIQKNSFYSKSKVQAFKEMEEEPEKAEDEALEYLQGMDGFSSAMDKASGGGSGMKGISGSKSEINEELMKRGFQTKKQLQSSLTDKFGAALPSVASSATKDLQKYQDKLGSAKSLKNAKKGLASERLNFKVNPMRGLPLRKRIEQQYGWQVTRASADGKQPAVVEPSAMYGFKHTPRLTYGVGASVAVGLGSSWSAIHPTFQGLGTRTFATWKFIWRISGYAGYERMFKQLPFVKSSNSDGGEKISTKHGNEKYSESVLVGLTKNYNLNKKYNGCIQLLYDVWWQEKGMQSPIVVRFITEKK